MVETETKKKVTLEEFMQLPDERVELINGQVVNEPAPTHGHQKISLSIATEIYNQLKQSHKGEIVAAPVDVLLGDDVVQPDLFFIATERLKIIQDGKVKGVPDVAFEITEYATNFNDTKVKFDIYECFGVKEYFIVYPDDKTVVKSVLTNGKFHEEYREVGLVKSEAMGCEVNF